MADVAPVRARRRPPQGIFLGAGPREELGARLEDGGDGAGRDGEVLEVDEARGLEAVEDRGRSCLSLAGRAVEELGEIYELRGGVCVRRAEVGFGREY